MLGNSSPLSRSTNHLPCVAFLCGGCRACPVLLRSLAPRRRFFMTFELLLLCTLLVRPCLIQSQLKIFDGIRITENVVVTARTLNKNEFNLPKAAPSTIRGVINVGIVEQLA